MPREDATYFGVSVEERVYGLGCVDGLGCVGRVVEVVVDGRVIDGGVGLNFASCLRPLGGERRVVRHPNLRR